MKEEQILTVKEMRAAEQRLFDAGMPEFELMQRAASRAADWVRRIAAGRKVTILCGPGNNGGDGYVMAHYLHQAGLKVQIVAPEPPKTDAAKMARDVWDKGVLTSGGEAHGEVFVDCLFGSGLTRPLSGEHALLLRDLAERHQLTIALDVPSGVSSDSGALLNEPLPCFDVTLAIGAWKYAHCLAPARVKMGVQRLVPIGIAEVEAAAFRVRQPKISQPSLTDHKYRRGFAAIIGGDMPGASMLACEAAMRAGAGYVKLAAKEAPGAPPDLVVDTSPVRVVLDDPRLNAVLIGPGLGRHEGAAKALEEALRASLAAVLDADALHLVRPHLVEAGRPILATPHDGELDVLCRNFGVIAEGRMARAKALAQVSGMVICAKGPDTVIASPEGEVAIAPPAPSWLSVAGTGDVLAGIAVSRMANGAGPFNAACEAVWLHGEAARQCGAAFTPLELAHGVTAAIEKCL